MTDEELRAWHWTETGLAVNANWGAEIAMVDGYFIELVRFTGHCFNLKILNDVKGLCRSQSAGPVKIKPTVE